jgi:hypothetical protein
LSKDVSKENYFSLIRLLLHSVLLAPDELCSVLLGPDDGAGV